MTDKKSNVFQLVPKSDQPETPVHTPSEWLNIVATDIEQGSFGEVNSVVVILDGEYYNICGNGKGITAADCMWLLQKGIYSFIRAEEED